MAKKYWQFKPERKEIGYPWMWVGKRWKEDRRGIRVAGVRYDRHFSESLSVSETDTSKSLSCELEP